MTLQYPLPARGRGLYQNRIKEKNIKSRTISCNNNEIRYNKPNHALKSRISHKTSNKKKNKSLFYGFYVLFFFFLCYLFLYNAYEKNK
ncbi:hypothetical protein FVI09_25820 [Escherichia coli]|nr:hypothetical protein [Escherichia coli]